MLKHMNSQAVVRPSVCPILVNMTSQERPLGLCDEPIRFWWSEVEVTVTAQNTFFSRYSAVHIIIMKQKMEMSDRRK